MTRRPRTLRAIALAWTVAARAHAQVDMLTWHNDLAHTGQNLQETTLTPANVNVASFGKLFSVKVDGWVYGQPLYKSQVAIPGKGTHNVVYVVTEHDSIYAFDADARGAPLWHVTFLQAGVRTVSFRDIGTVDIIPEIGITSTPVIDDATGTLYVVAKTKEGARAYVHRLHALDIATGDEKFGGPVVIEATVPGSGGGSDGTTLPFDPRKQNQRAGLTLANGIVYIGWSAHGTNGPYHGWLMGYDAQTLAQVAVFNSTPNGNSGGIWQAGSPPAIDADGNLFLVTGNGTFDGNAGGGDYGDTLLKLSPTLDILDYFTPSNALTLDVNDRDFGSGGPVLLPDQPGPHPHLVVACGKEGTIYLTDRDDLGQFNADTNDVVQSLEQVVGGTWSLPAYWNGRVYYGGVRDNVKALPLTNGQLAKLPTSVSPTAYGYPGATPAVSANGTTNAVVWAIQNDGFTFRRPAILHAYDALNLAHELYNSTQNGHRDGAADAVKFTVPTVVNGKVYVGGVRQLTVYGLLNGPTTTLPPTPASTLCSCGSDDVCEVTAGTYPVNPGSDLNFGTCALVIDSGVTIQLTSSAGPAVTIEAGSLHMNPGSQILGAPATQAPDDGGDVSIAVTGDLLLDPGSSIDVDAQNAGTSEINLSAGGAIKLSGSPGATMLSASALDAGGDGGNINATASGIVTIDGAIAATGGTEGAGGNVSVTTRKTPLTVTAPIDASGGAYGGGSIDLEPDLDLTTTETATLAVNGGDGPAGGGGLLLLNANVSGAVTLGGAMSARAVGGRGGELDSSSGNGPITVGADVDLRGDIGGGTLDIEPTGDLAVNGALLLAGSAPGGCGGQATLGASGTGTVTLSDDPIDASGNACGGRVIVNADSTVSAAGEVNADDTGVSGAGGLISITATTITVSGTLHANGGGEVHLQACTLTLEPSGQVLATGPGGFTLFQASGPMEIDGTLVAESTNTLDYLDPAHLPVVNSVSISPDADIVENDPPVSPLCPGQVTTTTTTSAVTTSTTTTTSSSTTSTGITTTSTTTTSSTSTSSTVIATPSTVTSTTVPQTTTSTTSTTTAPTTTTTSTTLGTCSPAGCDDRGPCMPGTCVDGVCQYATVPGTACATITLDQFRGLVDGAVPNAFKNRSMRRKLARRLRHVTTLVDDVGRDNARVHRARRRAERALSSLARFVDRSATHHRIDGALANSLGNLALEARSALAT
jgi:hypothetical protein